MHTIDLSVPPVGEPSFDAPRNTVWYPSAGGAVTSVRLLDGATRTFGGYDDPVAALPLGDGLSVAIVESDGRVLVAPADRPTATRAAVAATLDGPPTCAALGADGASIVAGVGADVVEVALPPVDLDDDDAGEASVTTLASALGGDVLRLAVARDGTLHVIVAPAAAAAGALLRHVDAIAGTVADLADPPADGCRLVSHPTGGGVLVVDPDGAVAAHLDDGTIGPEASDFGVAVVGACRWDGLVIVLEAGRLHAADWALYAGPLELRIGIAPLFLNGYADLSFDASSVGLAPDDVDLHVLEGEEFGTVSVATVPMSADGRTIRRLLAGWLPGEYTVGAFDRTSGDPIGAVRFRVTANWPDPEVGPPVVSAGEHITMQALSWGGIGGLTGYLAKDPPPSSWRVAVVLVATKDRRYGTDAPARKQSWRRWMLTHSESAKAYYEEVSYFTKPGGAGAPTGMTVELAGDRILGPVNLDAGWGDLFKVRKAGDLNGGWLSQPGTPELLAQAVSVWLMDEPDGHQILSQADAVVFVVRAGSKGPVKVGDATLPTKFVWGHARRPLNGPDFTRKDQATSTLTQGPLPVVVMTDAYPSVVGKVITRSLSHELGHTLDLDDLYDADDDFDATVLPRLANHADLMATSGSLPQLSVANRVRLGWIKRSWLKRFDFSNAPVGGNARLRATADLTRNGPPPGEFAGIEVPIDATRSYVFEYRREAAATVGDQRLDLLTPTVGRALVLGTDVTTTTSKPARPPILFLPNDADGDGPVLDAPGEDYRDDDTSDPLRMWDFEVRLDAIDPADLNRADVVVNYVSAHRPQLILHPAPGDGDFKSRDIVLVNGFGEQDFVVKGAPNTVRIEIHNEGTLDATNVVTHVKWLPFTTSAGAWVNLKDPPPIPVIKAKQSVKIEVVWDVDASVQLDGVEVEHFCFRAEVERFSDPIHPEHEEIVVFDNWAQSNFSTASVGHGSPSERVETVMGFANPLAREATWYLGAAQSRDLFRVYVGHAWLRVPAGVETTVPLAYESLAGDPVYGGALEHQEVPLVEVPNVVAVSSWREPPADGECATPREWFGAAIAMTAGRRVWFESLEFHGEIVTGYAFTSRDGVVEPVSGGNVELTLWSPDEPDVPALHCSGEIDGAGEVRVIVLREAFALATSGRRVVGKVLRYADTEYARAVSEEFPIA